MCTPLVYRGLVYIVKYNGVLSVYEARTGEVKFQQRLAGGTSAFTAAPIAADGQVYLASEECQSTHGVFSSVAGRYARISVGVGQGWRADGGRLATVEVVAQHGVQIADDKTVGRPQFVYDEIRMVIEGLS